MQPPSKAETDITDAKEDNSYQEKHSYQQEVNIASTNHASHDMARFSPLHFITVHLGCDIQLCYKQYF